MNSTFDGLRISLKKYFALSTYERNQIDRELEYLFCISVRTELI